MVKLNVALFARICLFHEKFMVKMEKKGHQKRQFFIGCCSEYHRKQCQTQTPFVYG